MLTTKKYNMNQLQNEFQAAIEKIQAKAVQLARQEFGEQITHLQKKVDHQAKILNEVREAYEKFTFEMEAEEKEREAEIQYNESVIATATAKGDLPKVGADAPNHEVTVCASVSDEKDNLNGPPGSHAIYLEDPGLHSIKDRVTHMGRDPEIFSNTDLAHIGRQMSAYYRKTYNGRSPEKKEEKINDKHNSSVCAYAKVDWPYMDKLIKTNLDPLHRWWVSDEKENFEKHTGAETEVHSIKDRLKHMNQDLQRFDNKDLCSIGKKMVTYYRKMNKGEDPPKKDERINDKHNSLVCAYSETDWEYLDYLITTNLKI